MESTSDLEVPQLLVARQPWPKWSKVLFAMVLVVTVLAGGYAILPSSSNHVETAHMKNADTDGVVSLMDQAEKQFQAHEDCKQCVSMACGFIAGCKKYSPHPEKCGDPVFDR